VPLRVVQCNDGRIYDMIIGLFLCTSTTKHGNLVANYLILSPINVGNSIHLQKKKASSSSAIETRSLPFTLQRRYNVLDF